MASKSSGEDRATLAEGEKVLLQAYRNTDERGRDLILTVAETVSGTGWKMGSSLRVVSGGTAHNGTHAGTHSGTRF